MNMNIDRDIVNDGDVLDIQAHNEKGGDITFVFTLSHRANGWQILLTASEMEKLLSEAEGRTPNP